MSSDIHYCNIALSVNCFGNHFGPLSVSWIHHDFLLSYGADRFHHVLRYAESSSGNGIRLMCAHLASTSSHVRYASLFLSVPGMCCGPPALTTWLANNSTPHARCATAIALFTLAAQAGGILATWLLGYLSPSPDHTAATITFIIMSICMVVFYPRTRELMQEVISLE